MKETDAPLELARLRLSAFCGAMGLEELRETAGLPLAAPENVRRAEKDFWAAVKREKNAGVLVRYEHILRTMGLNRVARCALVLALGSYADPELYALCASLGVEGGVSVELAAAVEDECYNDDNGLPQQEEAYGALELILTVSGEGQPFFRRVLAMDEGMYLHLSGFDKPDRALSFCAQRFNSAGEPAPLYARELEKQYVMRALLRAVPAVVQISGEEGVGKRFLLKQAAGELGFDFLFVDAAALMALPPSEQAVAVWRVRREMLLSDLGVCLYGVTRQTDTAALVARCMEPLMALRLPVCVCTDEGTELIPLTARFVEKIALLPLDRNERIALWEGYHRASGLPRVLDYVSAASKYCLNAGQIKKAVERLAMLSPASDAPIGEEELSEACSQVLPAVESGVMKRARTSFTMEDLKLPPAQKRILRNICAHVSYRHQVYDVWNLESRYAYGKAVAALFTGPPGTGKTMAAHVIANTLALPLYTIDLSQVVDKYIGETEKKLEEIFNHAQRSNSILFFDEADAIFGKRSEVNDARDRYANTEVSYILQRIEQYDGVVLLATNLKKNIDEAFMRRIRYLVEFNLPNEGLRRQIWEACFPPETPLFNLDFEYLARQFELAGGTIKNIALNAAFLAAEEGQQVGMPQILYCIREESRKQGETMLKQDFGEYAGLLP